jgi:hypothetical protein
LAVLEEGTGWRPLHSAPRGVPILLLIRESAGMLVPTVGHREGGKWLVRAPHSSDRIEIRPHRWAPIPRAPL